METQINELYPIMPEWEPSAPPLDGGQSYRLQKINEIQRVLEDEREKRHNLSKKYHKAVKVVGNIDSALVTISMGLSVAGVGILSTVIAVPAVIVMETTALGAGFLGIIGSQFNKMLMRKAEKHEKIKVIAETKLDTINGLISKALTDNKISDEEYTLILSEVIKYRKMKEDVRSKTRKSIDEEMRTSLINQGREEARNSFRKMFHKNNDENSDQNSDENSDQNVLKLKYLLEKRCRF